MEKQRDWDNAFTGQDNRGRVSTAPSFAGALSFMRRRYSKDLHEVDIAVTGIPVDSATSNRPGARFGPRAIRAISASMSWNRPWPWRIDPLEQLNIVDYGDCVFDFGKPDTIHSSIQEHVAGILDQGAATLTIGGDHFITYPILEAYASHHGPLSLIHFDAHSDTWPEPGERMDHGTMFYHATRRGLIDDQRSVQIGLRTTNDAPLGFTILDARYVHQHSATNIAEQVKRVVGSDKVYLTFDIDCLDPSFAPGTGTPVCGGLSTYQALEIIRALEGINLVGMDVVEVAPAYDAGDITALAASTIAMELLCLFAAR